MVSICKHSRNIFKNPVALVGILTLSCYSMNSFAVSIIYTGTASDLVSKPLNPFGPSPDKGLVPSGGVIGTYSHSNNQILINFTADGSGNDEPKFVYGGFIYEESTAASVNISSKDNNITINGGSVNGEINGGYAQAAINTISSSSVSANALSTVNRLNINGSTKIWRSIYAGHAMASAFDSNSSSPATFSAYATANDNMATFDGDVAVDAYLYGGYAEAYAHTSNNNATITAIANNNKITLSERVKIGADVHGGYATGNTSGLTASISTTKNAVELHDGAKVVGNLYGGAAFATVSSTARANVSAEDNKVILKNRATVNTNIYGGYAYAEGNYLTSVATINNVSLNGNAVTQGHLYGGYAAAYAEIDANSTVRDNTVTLNESATVEQNLYGGYAHAQTPASAPTADANAEAYANTVNINDTATMGGIVYGGYGYAIVHNTGTASVYINNNTVNIHGSPVFSAINSSIYGGGYAQTSVAPNSFDVFSGNTLNFSASPITIKDIANFEYYNFVLPAITGGSTIPLITADTITLDSTHAKDGSLPVVSSKVKVTGIQPGGLINVGDQFVLMQATNTMTGQAQTENSTITQGISLEYDVEVTQNDANKQITATITNRSGGLPGRVKPQLKALSEGRMAGVMHTLQGADIVANDLQRSINIAQNQNSDLPFTTFITLEGQHNRYNSGSHIDLNTFNLATGISYRPENLTNLTVSAFIESGWGNYDSYNSFYNALAVHGKGHTGYYGGGVFGQYEFNNGFYVQGSIRTGKTKTSFDSKDIMSAAGLWANYDNKSDYNSAHLGAGYVFNLNESNALDISGKYLWTKVGSNNLIMAGDPIHFEAINSRRIRVMGQWKHQYSERTMFNATLGYEYEMDAKARGTTYHVYQIDTAEMKGGTGIIEVGVNLKPFFNANSINGKGLSLDVKARGYVGKREGFGAMVNFNYEF